MSAAPGTPAAPPEPGAPPSPPAGPGGLTVTPTQPPGTELLSTVLNWLAWGVSIACIAGVLLVAGQLALSHRRGEAGGENMGRLGWVLGAAVLGSAAGPLVGALT